MKIQLMRRSRTVLALALVALAACGTQEPKPDEDRIRSFASKGYRADVQYSVQSAQATWQVAGSSYQVTIVTPSQNGNYPVVIYLPGLGQGADAGEYWRQTWAKNGYSVLSVQALESDGKPIVREKNTGHDVTPAARARYSAESVVARVAALQAVVDEALRRRAAGDALCQHFDFERTVVAGFDVGAYTATVLAGEHLSAADQALQRVTLRAAIAISPYATFSGSTFAARYSDVRVPVLSITSDIDSDSDGLVSSPSVRGAPFRFMPAHDNYLLTFYGLPHLVLSGSPVSAKDLEPLKDDDDSERHPTPSKSRSMKGGGPSTLDPTLPPTQRAIDAAAIEGISSAFLDATLKGDTIAREWLDKNAAPWLGDHGTLQHR